eukprot:GHVT01044819.1.p1 GENE.GHVT01044819.1~~GHVT01044819.1.p1  ORF type:complete len:141 (+),score=8.97 GHVT01044819.1:253-675(+)
MDITIDFGGGLDRLFGASKRHVKLENCGEFKIGQLIAFVRQHLVVERPDLFAEADVCPTTPCTVAPQSASAVVGGETPTATFDTPDGKVVSRPILLAPSSTVRPGILVLVNDTDWELEGGQDRVLHDKDCVCFISTLHGG